MEKLDVYQVDAFTDQPFAGNPAAVCILEQPQDDSWMQSVAAEMNLSETAFLLAENDGFGLRWFTPLAEVDLCGHATLASAHVLWNERGANAGRALRFSTRSGILTAIRKAGRIELDFPGEPPEPCEPPDGLLESLGVESCYVGSNRFDYLVDVGSEEAVLAAEPDYSALGELDVRGVMITGRSTSPLFDFVSRFFAPRFGINEDPVTGSAHCCLGPYWASRIEKTEFIAYQASRRGGQVRVRVEGDRVALSGQAVTVLSGQLTA